MKVEMHEVESSNLEAVGFREDTLVVKFKKGAVYSYNGVDRSVFEDLLNAESVGKFFNANVRKAFPYKRESTVFDTGSTIEIDWP